MGDNVFMGNEGVMGDEGIMDGKEIVCSDMSGSVDEESTLASYPGLPWSSGSWWDASILGSSRLVVQRASQEL